MRIRDHRGTGRLTRRIALRTLFAIGVVAGTAGALAPLVRHGGERAGAAGATAAGVAGAPPATPADPAAPADPAVPVAERFAETYQGRRIEGSATVLVPASRSTGVAPASAAGHAAEHTVEVRIDGRPLHVMRRADGSYLSAVNHYESFPTLRAAARAAVDDLGTARLSQTPAHAL
ncbi:tyrosinase family oxidase copper chaperone [Streptomyces sp. NPDC047315]|uniref:tyrosinase family oxidase copper chaperone n=1 Tax=Streptomyces sp. NPDC047315 TaxID=3155142 RepID=UPI0033FD9DF5